MKNLRFRIVKVLSAVVDCMAPMYKEFEGLSSAVVQNDHFAAIHFRFAPKIPRKRFELGR